MDYIELTCAIMPYNSEISEILVAGLGQLGFESFVEQNDSLQAYITENEFDETKVKELISHFKLDSRIDISYKKIEQENWNETWEKNYFEPIVIAEKCVIRSSFHPEFPDIKYSITIDPKMAFGTGHHETTSLMITEILELELIGKRILDMGCGTGILAILGALKGAIDITAVDNDVWSFNNTLENIKLNNVPNIKVIHGDFHQIMNNKYDLIFANINKNVLLSQIPEYKKCMNPGGLLLLSGFYKSDIEDINKPAIENNLQFLGQNESNNWLMLKYLNK
jgi:ribosomal protein L11 methyltransferase